MDITYQFHKVSHEKYSEILGFLVSLKSYRENDFDFTELSSVAPAGFRFGTTINISDNQYLSGKLALYSPAKCSSGATFSRFLMGISS
ncbi:MAG: hypothetical protein FD188_3481 [Ignavibacteria bacterium]|nr:MAG: hypothetical protein FD188_3481 [Ignavibacteria bacterium]